MLICALDMGKTIGLAKYSKEIGIVFAIGDFNFTQVVQKINSISPDMLVIGLPLSLNNQENEQCKKIRSQTETLLKQLNKQIPHFFYDERFSTKFTSSHASSAAWILETFLKHNANLV